MPKSTLKRLLIRYHKGEATAAERFIVETWYESFLEEKSGRERLMDEQELKARLLGRIERSLDPRKRRFGNMIRLAAAALLIPALTAALYYYNSRLSWTTHRSGNENVLHIVLRDSSEVWMNRGSVLRYRSGFGTEHRHLELVEGEAYFKVKKDTLLPFTTKSGKLETIVVGTQFLVSNYPDMPMMQVQVTRGRVNVKVGDQNFEGLTAGESVAYDRVRKIANRDGFQHILFDHEAGTTFVSNASFDEFSAHIKRLYGYRLVASNNQVQQRRYTGRIGGKYSLTDILERYNWIHQGRYTVKGKEVIME